MYLSIAAVLGTFLRIAMAQLFGDECANPGTVGWLAASSPLCVTKDGESEREGGIVFAVSRICEEFLCRGAKSPEYVLGYCTPS